MSAAQHTPGPWQTDEAAHDAPYQNIRVTANGRSVCTVWIDDAPVPDFNAGQEANARLIAAAPELLAACKLAFDQTCSVGRPKDWEQLRAAIVKATGGAS